MSRRISKRVREEAADLCAIAASQPGQRPCYDHDLAMDLGYWRGSISATAKHPVVRLALDAWCFVFNASGDAEWTEAIDAEAECLLREGWSP